MSSARASNREKGSAITRVMQITEAVAKADHPLTPADLACLLDIPKPSIHRLLGQLESDGFCQTNMRGQIIPGAKLQSIAWAVLHHERFSAVRRSILQKLTQDIGETCGIAVPKGTEMVYYDRVPAEWPLQVHLSVGSHTPCWCTASGKLYLSTLPKERRLRIVNKLSLMQYTRNTITDAGLLENELQSIKRSKIGIDNEEFVDGMVACAVPIKNSKAQLVACLFTHAPVIRKTLDQLLDYSPLMQKAAAEIGQLIDDS